MTAHPVWFGPPERPLFGWVHLPERARGGVVLCPPIGEEFYAGYRAYLRLTEQLVAGGLVVLRFDWSGTGDSAGSVGELAGTESFVEDVLRAVETVRATGVPRVGVVGLRAGALFALHALGRSAADALVLWDPCSGREFVREQRLLYAASKRAGEVALPREAGVEIPGMVLPRPLADGLERLPLEAGAALPQHVLVLLRPGAAVPTGLDAALTAAGAERGVAVDHDRFFDPERFFEGQAKEPFLPLAAIAKVAQWCTGVLGGDASGEVVPEAPARSWEPVVLEEGAGVAVSERPVSIGGAGLFGIVSEPRPGAGPEAPAMILLSVALHNHGGPSRLWVELARACAAGGARVLRLDLSGIGDSPRRASPQRENPYPPEGIGDAVTAARYLVPDGPERALLVGLSSGAYHAAEAALVLGSRSIFLLNPAVPPASLLARLNDGDLGELPRRTVRHVVGAGERLRGNARAVELAHRYLPSAGWWALDRLRLCTHPLRAFEPLTKQGTDVHVVCGADDANEFVAWGDWALRNLRQSGRFHFEVVGTLNHAVLRPSDRAELTRMLIGYLTAGTPSGTLGGASRPPETASKVAGSE